MFILIDKPKGISSFTAIKQWAKENKVKKVGHAGTLDPVATGLLLLATDEDTKLIDYIGDGTKTYSATAILGSTSSTFDSEGEITLKTDKIFEIIELVPFLKKINGTYMQTPPIFSAKKIDGKRAYKYAREGKKIEMTQQQVTISDFNVTHYSTNRLSFNVTVSKGTYIRSIINDLGESLGSGAYMSELRRTHIGTLDETLIGKELDVATLMNKPIVKLNKSEIINLFNGKIIDTSKKDGEYIISYNHSLVGVVNVKNKIMKTKKIFGEKIKELKYENN